MNEYTIPSRIQMEIDGLSEEDENLLAYLANEGANKRNRGNKAGAVVVIFLLVLMIFLVGM